MKRTLILGITGQDGAYLAKFLLRNGYEVMGSTRGAYDNALFNLDKLGIHNREKIFCLSVDDLKAVMDLIKIVAPDEVYNLAGQTSVGLSFEQPVETMTSIAMGTLNILEAIRLSGKSIRFFNAGSSECFGDTHNIPATEETPFSPRSPYAVAKAAAHGLVANYRDAYGLFACTGILFNHESPLRPARFVTQKIILSAASIADGTLDKLRLGNLDIYRDWGWAPDYVEAMWLMLQQDKPQDFVIATGKTVSLLYFVQKAFAYFGLDWQQYVESDATLMRPSDVQYGRADPSKARQLLGWVSTSDVDAVISQMCAAAVKRG